jgi:hypothetical protein
MLEHLEVDYDADEDACIFVKTTGIDQVWDAVAWTENDNVRNLTWHTIGKNADRDFGYTADPIADSTEEPVKHGVAVAMDINDQIAPPAGLVVEKGGHTTKISMDISAIRTTDFNIDGRHWGTNEGNMDVALQMHAIMWIKQRCGKLKLTDIKLWLPCKLSQWTSWGDCHPKQSGGATCGAGIQDRTRKVNQQGTFGSECHSALKQSQACDQGCCPVDCEVSEWSDWGDCSESCGGGSATRTRKVTTQDSCGGKACGPTEQTENCNFWVECEPQDCEWSECGDFGACSVKCGGGTQSRSRDIAKESKEGGKACKKEDSSQINTCNTQVCEEVNCEWTAWGDWSSCSADCNGGSRTRSREVTQEALNGGDACDAASAESEECELQPCSDIWTAGDGAKIKPDGVTFEGTVANAVVTSQVGVESISIRNGAVSGTVQVGLATDTNADFATGQSVQLPYDGAEDADIITIGSQFGHAKVFINQDPTPVKDLGKIADPVLAKIIFDEGASVTVDGIVTPPPALVEEAAVPQALVEEAATAPNWIGIAAVAAVFVSIVAAIARRSSRASPDEQPYQQLIQQ